MLNSSLPTDNLYKFLAIAGVALIIFSFYMSHSRMDLMWQRQDEWMRTYTKTFSELRTKTNQLKQNSGENAKALKDEILKLRMAMINDDFTKWQFRETTLDLFNELQVVLYLGCLLAAIGFTFWYTRVQKYLDAALKKQSQN
jgi:hypothetical protein